MTDKEIKFIVNIYNNNGSCCAAQRNILDIESEEKRQRSIAFHFCRITCPLRYHIIHIPQCNSDIAKIAAEKIMLENKYIFMEELI